MDALKTIDVSQLKSLFPVDSTAARSSASTADGRTLRRKTDRRRFVTCRNGQRAAEQIGSLPAPDETVHLLMAPNCFAAFDLLPAALSLSDCPAARVVLLTLGTNERHLIALRDMADAGQLNLVQLVVSDYFRGTDRETFKAVAEVFNCRPDFQLAVSRTHCKVIAIELTDGRCFVFSGSPNLRSCRSWESMDVAQSRELFDWYARFADDVLEATDARS